MTMNIRIFERNAELYGPDYLRWPDANYKEIESFLEKNDKAQDILKEAQKLLSVLDSYHVPGTKADLSSQALEKIDRNSNKIDKNHNVFQASISNDQYYASALHWVAVASFIVLLCGSIVWFVQDNNPLRLNQEMVIVSGNQTLDSIDSVLDNLIADEIEIEESMQLLAVLERGNSVPLPPDNLILEQKEDVLIEEYLEEWEDQQLERFQDIWEFFMEENSQQGYKRGQNRRYS